MHIALHDSAVFRGNIQYRALVSLGAWVLQHPYFFEIWVLAPTLLETWVLSISLFMRLAWNKSYLFATWVLSIDLF